MSEQTLNVNVTVQKDKKKNIRKAGKTLLIKPNEGVEIDNVGNSLDSLKTLRKKHEGDILVKFAHYKVFFTMTGLSDESDYNSIKTKHSKFIEDNTDSKVLYYKLYRNKSYLGCGDVTIDTKSGLDSLLDKEKFKEFDLSDNTGVFYRYNSKKSNMDEKEEGDAVEADV